MLTYLNLKILGFYKNEITTLHPKAFYDLPKLVNLDLRDTKITDKQIREIKKVNIFLRISYIKAS